MLSCGRLPRDLGEGPNSSLALAGSQGQVTLCNITNPKPHSNTLVSSAGGGGGVTAQVPTRAYEILWEAVSRAHRMARLRTSVVNWEPGCKVGAATPAAPGSKP